MLAQGDLKYSVEMQHEVSLAPIRYSGHLSEEDMDVNKSSEDFLYPDVYSCSCKVGNTKFCDKVSISLHQLVYTFFYRQLGCLVFSLRFWLSNCLACKNQL